MRIDPAIVGFDDGRKETTMIQGTWPAIRKQKTQRMDCHGEIGERNNFNDF